jgi:GNAT superfamily N-acetyltransferase
MQIRTLQSSDLNALLDLYAHLHTTDEPLPEVDKVNAIWQEVLSNPCCQYFGGFDDDRLVTSCTLMVIPNLTWRCRPYGVIENVVTDADFRNRGHGKAVLTHALNFAWAQSCNKVMLMTGRKDGATMHLYESAGFDGDAKQAFIAKPLV